MSPASTVSALARSPGTCASVSPLFSKMLAMKFVYSSSSPHSKGDTLAHVPGVYCFSFSALAGDMRKRLPFVQQNVSHEICVLLFIAAFKGGHDDACPRRLLLQL